MPHEQEVPASPSRAAYLANQFGGLYSMSELEELVTSSQTLMRTAASTCHTKTRGGMEEWAKEHGKAAELSCEWYHGTWQLLRLLNMVAVPRWYAFYHHALGNVLRLKPRPNVLISAAADYGMLATLYDALRSWAIEPKITLYDICETPLESSRWFAARHGIELQCRRANLLEAEIPEAPFDLIVTDEFLTVLKADYKPQAVACWKRLLAPGGSLVTTAMIGGATMDELRARYEERGRERLLANKALLFPDADEQQVADMLARIKKFARFHTRHMLSSEQELRVLLQSFGHASWDITCTPGECVNPTYSCQIVATV